MQLGVISSTFQSNIATVEGGGALKSVGEGEILLKASSFLENVAPQGNGGSIQVDETRMTIVDASFRGHGVQLRKAALFGGAIFASGKSSALTIQKSTAYLHAAD